MKRTACVAILSLVAGTAFGAEPMDASSPASTPCPVTLSPEKGAYGNEALQTGLWPDGMVTFKPGGPGSVLADGALSMKFWWWRLRPGQLTFEGRRLDGSAPPLRASVPDGYGPSGFQATALIFPTPGCWEVTGRLGEDRLTFVTRVVKIGDGPVVEPRPTDALTFASATRNTYLVVYRHGPGWVEGKPMREQPSLREHFAYYVDLHRKGLLIAGGGFTDESGGAAVFEAESDTAASQIIAADPAVQSQVFEFELQGWKANSWEEISQKRAARGE